MPFYKGDMRLVKASVICNVHWHSDVETGRVMGAAAVARATCKSRFPKRSGGRKGRDQKIIRKTKTPARPIEIRRFNF